MTRRIECFFMAQTGDVRRQLRRYRSLRHMADDEKCPGEYGYHNASRPYNEGPGHWSAEGYLNAEEPPAKDDPRWPTKCDACDYVFVDTDPWQVFQDILYSRVDTGERMTFRDAPVGAMIDADWYPMKGPDGMCLMVKTPGGEWLVDAPSTSGSPWTRTGTVPKITARPSILINNRQNQPEYHAFLTDGVLVDC